MFIPLYDRNSLKHIRLQYMTIGLIAVNAVVWLLTGPLASGDVADTAVAGLGYIPAVVFGYVYLPADLALMPQDATYVTYAFLHRDFMHLASNMLFLWVFGDNVEDAMGHVRFLLFYLLCAAVGAVSGVVTAYLMLHPKVRICVLVLFRIPLPLPAFVPLLFWIGQQFFMLLSDTGGSVSWGAHVGGILAGALLALVLRRAGVPLFDRTIVTPDAVVHTPPPEPAPQPAEERRMPPRWGRQPDRN